MSLGTLQDAYARFDHHVACIRAAKPRQPTRDGLLSFGATAGRWSESRDRARAQDQLEVFRDWVYTSIRPIAMRIAAQPMHIGRLTRTKASPKKRAKDYTLPHGWRKQADNIEVLEEHELLATFNDPNEVQVRWNLVYATVCCLDLTGRAHLWFCRTSEGLQVWQMNPSWLKPINGRRLLERWQLTLPNGDEEELLGDEVCYIHYSNPVHPLAALGPTQAIARSIDTDASLQTSQSAQFRNGVIPSLAIIIGEKAEELIGEKMGRPLLDGRDREQIRHAIRAMHAGAYRAGEPLIMDALIADVKKISSTPEEMNYLESGGMLKGRIQQGYGTNPIINGELEGANRASAMAADDHFCDNTVNPRIEVISQSLTAWAAPLYADSGERLVVWLEPARPRDRDANERLLNHALDHGAISLDDWRSEALNLPPLPGGAGQVRLMPFNLIEVPLNQTAGEALDDQDAEQDSTPPPQDDSDDETDSDSDDAKQATGRKSPSAKRFRERYRAVWLKQHGALESNMVDDLATAIDDDTALVLADLERTYREGPTSPASLADECFDAARFKRSIQNVALRNMLRAATMGANIEAELMGLSERSLGLRLSTKRATADVWEILDAANLNEAAAAGIRAQLAETMSQPYWDALTKSQRDRLSAAIARGIEDGRDVDSVTRAVQRALGPGTSKVTAERIARTELTGAINAGHFAQRTELMRLGTVAGSEWVCMFNNSREDHEEADGQVVGYEQMFKVGDEEAPYPGHWSLSAEQRINCQCTSIPAGVMADEDDE